MPGSGSRSGADLQGSFGIVALARSPQASIAASSPELWRLRSLAPRLALSLFLSYSLFHSFILSFRPQGLSFTPPSVQPASAAVLHFPSRASCCGCAPAGKSTPFSGFLASFPPFMLPSFFLHSSFILSSFFRSGPRASRSFRPRRSQRAQRRFFLPSQAPQLVKAPHPPFLRRAMLACHSEKSLAHAFGTVLVSGSCSRPLTAPPFRGLSASLR